ncbi:unnamed protein product [Wickerhamomyces anomalus]
MEGPSEVILTGTFDNWSGSLPLVKTSKGDFEITLPLKQEDDDKILFKFIVDGNWTTSKDYETINDNGNENNVLYLKNLSQVEESKSSGGSKIPEAGGLAAGGLAAAGAAVAGVLGLNSTSSDKENTESSKDYKPTVLPSNEGNHASVAGEPGVAIPSDPHQIKEFSEVRDVDAKELNAKLNKEDEFKTQVLPSQEGKQSNVSGEPGIAIPKDAQNIKEFGEVRNVDAKDLNAKLNKEDEVKTQVLPSNEGNHATVAGEPGVAVPKDAQNIKEFGEVRDVDAKALNEKLGGEGSTKAATATSTESPEKKTKKVPVKKLIRRNKETGEEVVVSSEPVDHVPKDQKISTNGAESKDTIKPTEEKTLDPKKSSAETNGKTTKDTATKTTEEKPKTTSTSTTTASKPKPKPKPAAAVAAEKKEEEKKKKSSVFKKFKKIFE